MRRSLLATTLGLLAIAASAGAATVPARHVPTPGRVGQVQAASHASTSTKPKKSKTKTTTTKDGTATTPAPAPTTTPAKPHAKPHTTP